MPHRPSPPAVDPPVKIRLAAGEQQPVQLGQVSDIRDRHQMVAAVAANLALHTTFSWAPGCRGRELRDEQIVRAQRDEPVRLDPPAALSTFFTADFRLSNLKLGNTPPNHSNACTCSSRNACWSRPATPGRTPPGERRAHHEQMHRHRDPGEHHLGLAPVDLRLHPGRVGLRDEHLADANPIARLRARTYCRTVVSATSAPCSSTSADDPPGGMPLLTRRGPIRLQPPIDHARYGPSFGAGRPTGDRLTGGHADASASRTARR